MKVCIPVEKNEGLNSIVYGHFGSAPAFAFCDIEKNIVDFQDNGNMHHEHGQCNPVGSIAGKGVEAIAVGGIGLRALMLLKQSGLQVYRAPVGSKLEEAIKLFKENKLEEISEDGCCAGHGCGHEHGH